MTSNGKRHDLWQAIDDKGEVLESIVAKTWDNNAELKFFDKAVTKYGLADRFVTDHLSSYGAALREIEAAGR